MIEPAPVPIDDTLYEPGYTSPTSGDESSFFDQDASSRGLAFLVPVAQLLRDVPSTYVVSFEHL